REARASLAAWKDDYNQERPHSALGNVPPVEFAVKMRMENRAT
ncbi:MAG: integrase core domain-containing protein, partial [Pseudomonadota bacterium]